MRYRFLAASALSALLAGGCGGEKKPSDAKGIPIGFFGAMSMMLVPSMVTLLAKLATWLKWSPWTLRWHSWKLTTVRAVR